MSAPEKLANYLQIEKYHPRSSAHGDKLCEFLLKDLLDTCEAFRNAAGGRLVVYTLNHVIDEGSPTQWNLDLVAGPPRSSNQQGPEEFERISQGQPSEIWLAIDAKTIMTEHGKARRNRQRDLNSLHDIIHRKDPRTIVGGLVVLNMAQRFKSPLRPNITLHNNVERLVRETISLLRGLPVSKKGSGGLDALGVIVISHTNIGGEPTKLVTEPPAPQSEDPLHYSMFLKDLCEAFSSRYV